MIAINSAILIVCLGGLWFGANWVVDSSVQIARKLGLSETVIGLTIVAIGTSAPEFAVSAVAALNEHSGISIGNVVGSNVFNLGLILGSISLIQPVASTRSLVFRDGGVLLGASLLLLWFMQDLVLSSSEGVIMMFVLAAYVGMLIYQREQPTEELTQEPFQWYHPLQLLGGLVIILTSSHFLVESASTIARSFGVTEWIIGVTIVAAGTSTPELVTSIAAAMKGRHGILAGNLIGSDLFNILGVLGLASFLNPLTVQPESYSSWMMLCAMVLFVLVIMRTKWDISRFEGGLLLLFALGRWGIDIFR